MKTNPNPSEHSQDAVADILAYHERTKHHPERYARGPGGLDWASQPDPFRRYSGAPIHPLPLATGPDQTPPASALFGGAKVTARPLTLETVGLFFELSLGLSARKEFGGSSWYLRMNPSSGNLHPTEAYAVLPALAGLPGGTGVYHYAPREHALEQRARFPANPLLPASPPASFHVGLTSICWREAWKYGERAFRYCQHDVGHALAALRLAAAALGWHLPLQPQWDDAQLAHWLGLDRAGDFAGAELETPELLVQVVVEASSPAAPSPGPDSAVQWFGQANTLSRFQVDWPVIDEAIRASERKPLPGMPTLDGTLPDWGPPKPPACGHTASQLIRQRRSAVNFDGVRSLSQAGLMAILDTTLPRSAAPPFDAWPFPPRLNLVLMVHRVQGLAPGLYLWLRAPFHETQLRAAFRPDFFWEAVTDSSNNAPLYRLSSGDEGDFARQLSCHQDIASDGAFSLGMLASFEPVLRERGAAAYRELFWEAGMIGQALYLAAEAAGVRGTGIGCYFDDVLHRKLGLRNQDWQSLYHFTVGGPVEDLRLRTAPPYAHLDS